MDNLEDALKRIAALESALLPFLKGTVSHTYQCDRDRSYAEAYFHVNHGFKCICGATQARKVAKELLENS